MLTTSEIVAALKTSRAEFARLFLQAQADIPAERREAFEAVGRDANDRNAFLIAVLSAQKNGWLENLLDLVVSSGLEDGRIMDHLVRLRAGQGDAELQAMVNSVSAFQHPHVILRGVADGIRWTAKVTTGNSTGTGVLVGPNLVLTAWHVVKSLFQPELDASGHVVYRPDLAAGRERLRFQFDEFLARVRRGKNLRPFRTVQVEPAADWYVAHSECHEEELAQRLPANKPDLDGYWDYCLIRVKSAPGMERRWAALDARAVVPAPDDRIIVFQHPAGQPMRVDQNVVARPCDYGIDPATSLLRFIHRANALSGSSGGPCFDGSFSLFGLHQGTWQRPAPGADSPALNRGVPLVAILEDIKKHGGLPTPAHDEVPTWELGPANNHAPVLGHENFQGVVWRAALRGRPRIIVLEGSPGTGKTFMVRVLGAMLADRQHLKLTLSAEAVGKQSALSLASTILNAAGVVEVGAGNQGMGAEAGLLSGANLFDSTASAWRRDEVVRRIVEGLDARRAGRLVWLSLTDLNAFEVQGLDARDLLLLIYEQTLSVDWLRIVLDGFRGNLPVGLREVVEVYTTSAPGSGAPLINEGDVATFLRRLNAAAELGMDEFTIIALSRHLFSRYGARRSENLSRTLVAFAEEVAELGAAYLEVVDGRDQGPPNA